jgi:hypothetical protein
MLVVELTTTTLSGLKVKVPLPWAVLSFTGLLKMSALV